MVFSIDAEKKTTLQNSVPIHVINTQQTRDRKELPQYDEGHL